MGKPWSNEDYKYLDDNWGTVSIQAIAKRLNRSVNAIVLKAKRRGLGSFLESGDYISLNQLVRAVSGHNSYTYILESWVEKRGLPIHTKKVNKNSFRIVYIDQFWKWAEQNRSFIDFSKIEPFILGKEPLWVAEQRKNDLQSFYINRKDAWSPLEDERLMFYLKQQKYGYAELSEMLNRSEGAIQRRCIDLKTKLRPVKADNHGDKVLWTEEMFEILAKGISSGCGYAGIGRLIGKSEKAVRYKVYAVYLTENADKVRKMLNGGKWGEGAPEPSVKQAKNLSQHRATCNKVISSLISALKYRMNELGYGTYWQREMCMNWDDYKGCKVGCENCDECSEFLRIKVQYCARCGTDFYERTQNRFCSKCRTARKKKAQKHYIMEKIRKDDF